LGTANPQFEINPGSASRPRPSLTRIANCTEKGILKTVIAKTFSHETSRNATPIQVASAARFRATLRTQRLRDHHFDDLSESLFALPQTNEIRQPENSKVDA
jgi:hypothetical protein